jgi:hypothetical protein
MVYLGCCQVDRGPDKGHALALDVLGWARVGPSTELDDVPSGGAAANNQNVALAQSIWDSKSSFTQYDYKELTGKFNLANSKRPTERLVIPSCLTRS